MFFIIGISISFFLAIILLTKKGKSLADKLLVAWLVLIGVHLGLYYSHIPSNNFPYPYLLGILLPLPLIHGPVLFFYALALTNPSYFKNYSWVLHLIPSMAMYVYLIPFFSLSASEKIYVFQHEGIGYEGFMVFSVILITISGFAYIIWSSVLLRQHKRNITQYFSYTERVNLDWLQYLIYGMGIIWLITLLGNDALIFAAVVAFVLFMGFYGIKQVGIFTYTDKFLPPQYLTEIEPLNEIKEGENIDNEEVIKKKYLKSGLSEEQATQLLNDLAHLMTTEKLFKNSELTLPDLATRLKVHPNYLSQTINEKEGVNFYDYVNTLRIDEFKKLAALPESKQYTLLALAYDCGFNSKSSFNRYFKKMTDSSPSEYMNSLN